MGKSGNIAVLLVRSGRTEWDEADRLQGKTDLPMTDAGREELAAAVRAVIDADELGKIGTVHCGPSEGSEETADLVAKAVSAKTRTHASLEGMDLGLWEGLLRDELLERYPKAYRQWRDDPASVRVPDGETVLDLELRVFPTLARIFEKASHGTAVVLRPIQMTLLEMHLGSDEATEDFWARLEDGPRVRLVTMDRSMPRMVLDGLKARA